MKTFEETAWRSPAKILCTSDSRVPSSLICSLVTIIVMMVMMIITMVTVITIIIMMVTIVMVIITMVTEPERYLCKSESSK